MRKRTNYHLTIINNRQDFYFHHEYIEKGDILRIKGYRVVITNKQYDDPYTELTATLVNEGEMIITDLR